MLPVFSKKTSWIFIILLLCFDNIVSYWAVVYRGAHEVDLAIAWLVERYPLLYFLCIPLTVILIYVIYKFLVLLATKLFKNIKTKMIEGVILTSIVFYWAIGNSLFNFLYLIGYPQPGHTWFITTTTMLVLAVIYTLLALKTRS